MNARHPDAPEMADRARAMGSASATLPERVDIAIIGGGIMGLSLAYHLSRISKLSIVVLERSYLVSGASGRNGGGLRMQWGDAGNVSLMKQSIELCRSLAQELDINLWFRQGGYLFLARTEGTETRLLRNIEVHRSVGAPTRLLDAKQVKKVCPHLRTEGVRLAAFNPQDGVVFPWPFVWGYAKKSVEQGVTLRTHTGVQRIEADSVPHTLHLSTGERLKADRIVNATGAWSIELNHDLGIDLPNHPHRHEILSSEPLKPFLDPLVVDLCRGLYFSQSTRGEIVTGVTLPDPPGIEPAQRVELGSSLRFLKLVSEALIDVMPIAARLHPLRQWAGPYDVSPDRDAMVGPSPNGFDHIIQVCGFTGHGFMMAPAVGKLLAENLANGTPHPMLDRWDPRRFERGEPNNYEDMIIG